LPYRPTVRVELSMCAECCEFWTGYNAAGINAINRRSRDGNHTGRRFVVFMYYSPTVAVSAAAAAHTDTQTQLIALPTPRM